MKHFKIAGILLLISALIIAVVSFANAAGRNHPSQVTEVEATLLLTAIDVDIQALYDEPIVFPACFETPEGKMCILPACMGCGPMLEDRYWRMLEIYDGNFRHSRANVADALMLRAALLVKDYDLWPATGPEPLRTITEKLERLTQIVMDAR